MIITKCMLSFLYKGNHWKMGALKQRYDRSVSCKARELSECKIKLNLLNLYNLGPHSRFQKRAFTQTGHEWSLLIGPLIQRHSCYIPSPVSCSFFGLKISTIPASVLGFAIARLSPYCNRPWGDSDGSNHACTCPARIRSMCEITPGHVLGMDQWTSNQLGDYYGMPAVVWFWLSFFCQSKLTLTWDAPTHLTMYQYRSSVHGIFARCTAL